MSKIVLVCGGRDYTDWDTVWGVLDDHVHREDIIVQGGAKGADALAVQWARESGVPSAEVLADWEAFGKSAGAIRNSWMLRLKPDKVIAFPGGKGTANMIKLAKEAGVEVIEVGE